MSHIPVWHIQRVIAAASVLTIAASFAPAPAFAWMPSDTDTAIGIGAGVSHSFLLSTNSRNEKRQARCKQYA